MRILTRLTSLVATISVAYAVTPAAPPTFETLFVGTFDVGKVRTINNGSFPGTRIYAPISGGNLTDTAGNSVANILPSADTGIVSVSGTFYPEAVLPLVWTADNQSAYLRLEGVGTLLKSDLVYIHLETASEHYSALNSRFLLGNVTFPPHHKNVATITIFGTV
ncbi:hypothetical protein C8Q80DRAFT_1350104 [Daedaleopsis nitida]|nr:hypothetical protein C8Q80DRAFT_1350104 [Daedaleopsis nitida]